MIFFNLWALRVSYTENLEKKQRSPLDWRIFKNPVETIPRIAHLSGAPVLDIQSRYRYSYGLSPCVFLKYRRVSRYTPLIRGKTNQKGVAIRGVKRGIAA